MARNPSVAVVMSTYNGAPYVRAQLESVLSQDVADGGRADLRVFVRDDGSTDETLDVLAPYERAGRISLDVGANQGVTGSFLSLLEALPGGFDYVALCDQDDVWHADKLSRALEVLGRKDPGVPQLYCSEYVFCDAGLGPQGRSHLNRHGVDFARMLYENVTSGNTMVMNARLADAIAQAGRTGVYCHDWWIALVATAVGELTYDDFASLDYRRTGANASATGTGALSVLRTRVEKFLQGDDLDLVSGQLRKLRDCFWEQMTPDKRALLKRCLTAGRLGKALTPVRLRQGAAEELALRLLFLLGRL